MKKSSSWTTFAQVAERYELDKMPTRRTTSGSYRGKLKNIILPKWGSYRMEDIRPLELDRWLAGLEMEPTTKAGVKTVMRQVFEYAMLSEVLPAARNPLDLIRIKGGSRRAKRPQILNAEQCRALVAAITAEPAKTMVIVALCLGIRRSELTGLKWGDFNWIDNTVKITRGIVDNHMDAVKTEASEKSLPLDPALVAALQNWRQKTPYLEDADWVFASPAKIGRKPFYPNYIQKHYLVPAGKAAGLGEHIGWHCLRHAYRSLLASRGASLTVQKELLRHSNISTTANLYGGALPDDQREANSAVVRMLIN